MRISEGSESPRGAGKGEVSNPRNFEWITSYQHQITPFRGEDCPRMLNVN